MHREVYPTPASIMNSDSEDSEPDEENPHLTPPELDYSHLPGQTA